MTENLYGYLKVKKDCTSDDIVEAWNKIQSTTPHASTQFLLAKRAYETLIEPVKREIYDKFDVAESQNDPVYNYYNFSTSFLEDKDVIQVVGKMKSTANTSLKIVHLPLTDFYIGKTISIPVKKVMQCSHCANSKQYSICPNCAMSPSPVICLVCNNSRRVLLPINCKVCNNTKVITAESATTVTIKPGALEGQILRCANLTTEVIIRQEKHGTFFRDGCDLYLIKKVNLTEALCGVRFVVNHLDGRKLLAFTSAGDVLHPGCRKVIPKEGMPVLDSSSGKRGDLIVIFQVDTPEKIQESLAKKLENLLPPRAEFKMPSHPETEEYSLTDFDPKFKLPTMPAFNDAYLDKYDNITSNIQKTKDQCLHQ